MGTFADLITSRPFRNPHLLSSVQNGSTADQTEIGRSLTSVLFSSVMSREARSSPIRGKHSSTDPQSPAHRPTFRGQPAKLTLMARAQRAADSEADKTINLCSFSPPHPEKSQYVRGPGWDSASVPSYAPHSEPLHTHCRCW